VFSINIWQVRGVGLKDAEPETLVQAFITLRLDYCNSLFYGLPN